MFGQMVSIFAWLFILFAFIAIAFNALSFEAVIFGWLSWNTLMLISLKWEKELVRK